MRCTRNAVYPMGTGGSNPSLSALDSIFLLSNLFIILILILSVQPSLNNIKKEFIPKWCIYIILLIFIHTQLLTNNYNINKNLDIACNYCNKIIRGEYFIQKGKNYHQDCYHENIQLKCDFCKKTISGEYNIDNKNNYHVACFRNNILEKCGACNLALEGEFIIDHWGNKYHESHTKETSNCESCNRLICDAITNGGYLLNGTREICNICWDELITDYTDIGTILSDVKSRLIRVGVYPFPKEIPITLVDTREQLEQYSNISNNELNGYTKYSVEKIGGITVSKEFEIFILSNLHEMIFNAVLAHELMHVYLFHNEINLPSEKLEGFCNLGTKLIYENYNNEFSKIKLNAMYQNQNPHYGKGFVLMDSILQQKGWKKLLQDLVE